MDSLSHGSGFGTTAIHAGQQPERWNMNQVVPMISTASTYKHPVPGEPKGYFYNRYGNPTRDCLHESLAALEDAKFARVFSSGMAAVASAGNLLNAGDHVISSVYAYGGTKEYFTNTLAACHGKQLTYVDMTNLDELKAALRPNTKMVWFETPSNPHLFVIDIAAVVSIAKGYNKDILVVVDNTFITPYFQKPLTFGVDIVMHSLSKYINGLSDVIMGALITNRKDIDDKLFYMQSTVPSSFDTYLVNRGIKTLHLRMEKHMENALAVARFLEANPRIEKVYYPELESHPQYKLHKKQAKGMSGMVSFYLKGANLEQSQKFLTSLKIIVPATSMGGVKSLIELPALMSAYMQGERERQKLRITENFIRLSVGCEAKEDLIQDLDQALKNAIPSV
ncbi:cys/Met metabolism PLP-dependent enzyme domain-containing protein [Ditylenchus destructor]|nr:cys/Met metabolism PLP-dependent enzyme domain-containing protein [Ditylenchus destructor]